MIRDIEEPITESSPYLEQGTIIAQYGYIIQLLKKIDKKLGESGDDKEG